MGDRKHSLKKSDREPLSPISVKHANARTPSRPKTPKTPGSSKKGCTVTGNIGNLKNENCGYDRFIPNRTMMEKEVSHYHLLSKREDETTDYNDKMKENLSNNEVDAVRTRILQMKIKPPANKEGEVYMKMLYTNSKPTPAKSKTTRYIPSVPEKILDAPEITNDYYLNLLDWGSAGIIAIALHKSVYLWNAATGDITDLFGQTPFTDDDTVITSVKWITEGNHLAVGLSNGTVQLWDAGEIKRVRSMSGHPMRVGTLDWNNHILTSGCKNGAIHNHDVRIAEHHISSFYSHTQEVCGMDWAPDGHHLASGSNDNLLNIWDMRKANELSNAGVPVQVDTPVISLADHTSAVKAVAWCPWQRHILASGGGIGDRHVRIWNAGHGSGTCLKSVDTMTQVSDIIWSETYQEILCSHGNQMTIWKYPSLNTEIELTGHTDRILAIAKSPGGREVATVAADETLRLWKCFEPPLKTSKNKPVSKGRQHHGHNSDMPTIR